MDHASRRARLASRLPELDVDAILITRLPNVRFLTGFSGTNGQAVVTADGGVFLTDGRYSEQSRREVSGLRQSVYTGETTDALVQACRDLGVERVGFESAGLTYRVYQVLGSSGLQLVPTEDPVEVLRKVKDREETELLSSAQAIADEAFGRIVAEISEGITERQLAFELDTFMREQTADGVAFDTIMAFGENAAEPHHHPTDRPLDRGDVVKMDFGCVVGGYHSDMTRTVFFGDPSARLQEVYEVVRSAQQAGVEAVREGALTSDVDATSRDLIREAGYGDAFPHGLGHGIGLEIHEAPWLRARNPEPLAAGEVVTVEPGIYLEGLGGVRIEDMVEVTVGGWRVIPQTPKELMVL